MASLEKALSTVKDQRASMPDEDVVEVVSKMTRKRRKRRRTFERTTWSCRGLPWSFSPMGRIEKLRLT